MGVVTWHPDMPLEYRDQIVTGDARELAGAIPDASVDLCFCDPVYDRLDDYCWLAETCNRLLCVDGALLCFCGIGYQQATQEALKDGGRPVRWVLPVIYSPPVSHRFHPKGFAGWAMLLWAGGEPKETFLDCHVNRPECGGGHRWTKNEAPVRKYLRAFSRVGDVVWDPFAGHGAVPAMAKTTGRRWIAFEQDPDTADRARQRLRNTIPPLLLPEPEPPLTLALEEAI